MANKSGLRMGAFTVSKTNQAVRPAQRGLTLTRGFTLIELLVVVAIIAVLISILLPSLNSARKSAKATVCASNMKHVGSAAAIYLTENNATYPFGYAYASNNSGAYDLNDQPNDAVFGYVHWTWFLYGRGQVADESFECPEINNSGHPRTNPGRQAQHWEAGQRDGGDNTNPDSAQREDKQAPRVAIAGNAAVFPRNKFTPNVLSGDDGAGVRLNRFVKESDVLGPRAVILATEFRKEFPSVCEGGSAGGGNLLSKSHRSINPFGAIGSGANQPYAAPDTGVGLYTYRINRSAPRDTAECFGLRPETELRATPGLLLGTYTHSGLNAVGRHHPSGDKLGGTANFLYIDGAVQRKTIMQTLIDREWGSKYYSITGNNEVRDLTADGIASGG